MRLSQLLHLSASVFSVVLALTWICPHLVHAQAVSSPSRKQQAARYFADTDPCTPERVPLTMRNGIALAKLTINHKTATFIVDSAGTTMVNSDRVQLPVVRELHASTVTVSAVDAMDWKVVNISELGLGSGQIRDLNVLSRSLPQLETKMNMEIDGILGSDMLMWWDLVVLDYSHKTLLLQGSRCTDNGKDSENLRMFFSEGAKLFRKPR